MVPSQLSIPVQGRSEWEVFYAYPTISAPALFEALARVSEEQAESPPSAAQAYDVLLELSRAAQVWPTRKAARLQLLARHMTTLGDLHHARLRAWWEGVAALLPHMSPASRISHSPVRAQYFRPRHWACWCEQQGGA